MTDERTFRRWGENGSIANERILGSISFLFEEIKRGERERQTEEEEGAAMAPHDPFSSCAHDHDCADHDCGAMWRLNSHVDTTKVT